MKRLFLSLVLFLAFAPAFVRAETVPVEPSELKSLKSQYQADVAAATKSIHERYVAQLESLLKDYTQRGNLPAALAIQQELDGENHRRSTGDTPAHHAIRMAMLGTWSWKSAETNDQGTIQFDKDGIGSHGAQGNMQWDVTGSREITITTPGKGTSIIHLSADSRTFTGTGYDGKPVAGKRMK